MTFSPELFQYLLSLDGISCGIVKNKDKNSVMFDEMGKTYFIWALLI